MRSLAVNTTPKRAIFDPPGAWYYTFLPSPLPKPASEKHATTEIDCLTVFMRTQGG